MKTIAQISDLHFGRTDPAIVEGLLADLAALKPDFIVVSGDLTQGARIAEFKQARDFLARLPAPYLVIPGNHDVPPVNILERFVAPFARYKHWIAPTLSPTHVEDDLAVIGVNTARRFRWRWNWALGSISQTQIARVRDFFAAFGDGVLKVVVTHHPFLPPPDTPQEDLAAHAGEAIPVFEESGVDLILSGHLHKAYTGEVGGHQPRAIHRSILVAQAGTATSTRVRGEPNAYNLVRFEGKRVGLSSRIWDGRQFVEHQAARFEKQADRWKRITEAAQAVPEV